MKGVKGHDIEREGVLNGHDREEGRGLKGYDIERLKGHDRGVKRS